MASLYVGKDRKGENESQSKTPPSASFLHECLRASLSLSLSLQYFRASSFLSFLLTRCNARTRRPDIDKNSLNTNDDRRSATRTEQRPPLVEESGCRDNWPLPSPSVSVHEGMTNSKGGSRFFQVKQTREHVPGRSCWKSRRSLKGSSMGKNLTLNLTKMVQMAN